MFDVYVDVPIALVQFWVLRDALLLERPRGVIYIYIITWLNINVIMGSLPYRGVFIARVYRIYRNESHLTLCKLT